MFRSLLLGIVMVLFEVEGLRYCHECKHFDGDICQTGMKSCWKFNVLMYNKSCSTENFYFYDRNTGRYLFRYTVLSCRPCAAGIVQVFHDLLSETFCCTEDNFCNDGSANFDIGSVTLGETETE
ncbi:hypothetical protein H920_07212 [Fukomys damarensis]|uniref:Prostate and testis expressed protein 2 n=1 Tax=Fukomys damarensis TaxID=885580 RepID=A0A091DJW4_FUKDA|nr:hypothetical protein H920_07212 [Fukomys damarensis]